jgi:hypothetical protein
MRDTAPSSQGVRSRCALKRALTPLLLSSGQKNWGQSKNSAGSGVFTLTPNIPARIRKQKGSDPSYFSGLSKSYLLNLVSRRHLYLLL